MQLMLGGDVPGATYNDELEDNNFDLEDYQTTSGSHIMNGTSSVSSANRNIDIILIFTFIGIMSRTLWIQSLLVSYVYLISSRDNITVGYVTSIVGISQLCTAFPTGYLSDKYVGRRHVVIRLGTISAFVSVALFLYAIITNNVFVLCWALALFGCYWGIVQTAILALFTDSIPSGLNSKYFTQRLLATRCGIAMGPFTSLIMFLCIGNSWTIDQCSWVLALSQVLSLPSLILLWYLKDDHTTHVNDTVSIQHDDEEKNTKIITESFSESKMNSEKQSILTSSYTSELYGTSSLHSKNISSSINISKRAATTIACTVTACDLITNLANGISIRFFPVFFMDKLSIQPVALQILYLFNPVLGIGMASLALHLSKKSSRCLVCITLQLIGIFFFFSFIFTYQYTYIYSKHGPSMNSRILVCVLFVFRTIFLNSTQALTKSILMDVVPKEKRGFWSAFESINTATWGGSAFLGGILSERYGLEGNFYICSTLHFFPTLLLGTIIHKLPAHMA